ncbi:MAG: recombinase RecX [Gallicola sp.]|uniref:regulatory protein RecX n=1 Tax=Gallicola sp. Sow4_E12 TaxID=3438785 RepID=UPI0018275731|nr:recombinase RecX [Gallicola sp.]
MIITKIGYDDKTNLFIIETPKESFQISYEDYEKYHLQKDQEINPDLYDKLKNIALKNKAYADAINFLSYRIRTEKEIKDKLNKKYSFEIVSSIIEKLTREGLIDDSYFARVYIESKLNTTNWSVRKVKYQLGNLGISNDVFEEELSKLDFSTSEIQNAHKLVSKQIEKWKSKYSDTYALRNKIYAYLSSRGFNYDTISAVMEEFVNE